jgi:hypothetical protein
MNKNQYVEFYNDLGKFKELHVEGLFGKYDSEGANVSLPFLFGVIENWVFIMVELSYEQHILLLFVNVHDFSKYSSKLENYSTATKSQVSNCHEEY